MTKIQKEADEIIHLMRQSRMDAIRKYIEECIRIRDKGSEDAQEFIASL